MDPVTAVFLSLAFAGWLAWRAWDRYPEWKEAAKRHYAAGKAWRPQQAVNRWEEWAGKHPDAALKRLWWAASAIGRLGKRLNDAAARYQERQREREPAAPDMPDHAEPDSGEGSGDGWTPPDWGAPDTAQPEPRPTPDPPNTPNPDPDESRPQPLPPPLPPPPAPRPLTQPDPVPVTAPAGAPTAAIADPATPPTPQPPEMASPGPLARAPFTEFMGDDMSTLTNGSSTAVGTMASVVRHIGELTGLSQILGAWKRLLSVASQDAALTDALTKTAAGYLAESEALCARLRATHRILTALEDAAYSNRLEPGALAVIHQAMEANAQALNAQAAAHQAIAAGVVAQRTANIAQQQSQLAVATAYQYMNRVHVPKRDVELATGARSTRDFSTT